MPLLLALAVLALAGGFSGWIYYRREFAVRGRALLLAARLLALAGLLGILWNPDVPATAGRDVPERFVVLDASASMAALDSLGEPVWTSATARARAMAQDGARLLVTGGARTRAGALVHPDSLAGLLPQGHESVLASALGTAAEAGAGEVVLVTDRRIADPVAVEAAARRLGVRVTVDSAVASSSANLGVSRLILPSFADSGRALRGEVHVEGRAAADSVEVVVAVDGRAVRVLRLPVPEEGEAVSAPFVLAGSLRPGPRRVSARLTVQDAFAPDDQRVRIVRVDAREAGILVVSFVPDWELRFLLPVLRQVTGMPVHGYLRTGPDRFQAVVGALPGAISPTTFGQVDSAPREVDLDELEQRIGASAVVVAMGVDATAKALLDRAAGRLRRLAIFPLDGDGASAGGVDAGDPQGGEWYVSDAPPSPVSIELGQMRYGGLPPLSGLLPLVDSGGGAALEVRLGGTGEPRPALLLRREGDRRVAVVLARGFWRWAFRDGEPRDRYRLLWGAVGGWLVAGESVAAGPDVSPDSAVAPPGQPMRWRARGREGEEVRLSVTDSAGVALLDSTWTVSATGAFATPALPPGAYRYAVGPETLGEAAPPAVTGIFEVESFSREALRRTVAPDRLTWMPSAPDGPGQGARPLRTLPWPYLVVLAALCAEWVGRRRAGLR